jgi:hypothetical protein
MKIIEYTCKTCGKDRVRIIFGNNCNKQFCCNCCKNQGVQPRYCKIEQLEFERFSQGKKLNENDVKGLLLEKALSDTLNELKILHEHNPFNNTYPCFQVDQPDITIEKPNLVIECKNLSEKQTSFLSTQWLDSNIIKRPKVKNYRRKLVLFSYKPRKNLIEYLNRRGWRVYGLGTQLLTLKDVKKIRGRIRQQFYWIKKQYNEQVITSTK